MARQTHRQLGFMQLVIMCGFSIFYTSYLLSFFGIFTFFPAGYGFALCHGAQVSFFAGTIAGSLAYLAFYRKEDQTQHKFGAWLHVTSFLLASALPLCVCLDVIGIALAPILVYAASLAGGVAIASGFSMWENLSARGHLKRGLFVHGITFATGGIMFLICMACLTRLVLALAYELFLALSILLALFIEPRSERPQALPVKPAVAFFKKTKHLDVVTYIVNAAFGFAFMLLYQMGTAYLLCTMAVAIFIDLIITLGIGRDRVLPFVGALRITTAAVACALILYACPIEVLKILGLGLTVSFWFVFRTINAGSLSEMAIRNGFSGLYVNIKGKLASNIGFTIGLGLGVVLAALGWGETAYTYTALGLVAAFVVSSLVLLPFENESDAPGFKTLSLITTPEPSSTGAGELTMEEKCSALSSRYKLSARETEVLAYVVKGRNAKHIAEKLYITESTTKTHIANIYRKVNVHSQQELLDLIDLL